jgi:hypothetical protein
MALIDTKLGPVDEVYLTRRETVIDDEERYGARIEFWPRPPVELAAVDWTTGDATHPNCGHGAVIATTFLADTVENGVMGPGTFVVRRESIHPPNCLVAKLARWPGSEPVAVYERIDWAKVNPFEETPGTVSVDGGSMPTADLEKVVTHVENDREYTHAVEYRKDGVIVHRSADVKLKRGALTEAAASNLG